MRHSQFLYPKRTVQQSEQSLFFNFTFHKIKFDVEIKYILGIFYSFIADCQCMANNYGCSLHRQLDNLSQKTTSIELIIMDFFFFVCFKWNLQKDNSFRLILKSLKGIRALVRMAQEFIAGQKSLTCRSSEKVTGATKLIHLTLIIPINVCTSRMCRIVYGIAAY